MSRLQVTQIFHTLKLFLLITALAAMSLALQARESDARDLFLIQSGIADMSIIDSGSNTQVGTANVGVGLKRIAFMPDGSKAYVTNTGLDTVSVIEGNGSVTGSIDLGRAAAPTGIVVSPDGDRAYVANVGSNSVSVIDTASDSVVGPPITAGNRPNALALTPDGDSLYVANSGPFSSQVSVINTGAGSEIRRIDVDPVSSPEGARPAGLTMSPDGSRLYVVNNGPNTVTVIDAESNTVLKDRIDVGQGTTDPVERDNTRGIAATPDGSTVYVSNNGLGSDEVSVIDTSTLQVTGSTQVGDQPVEVTVTPDGKYAYVSNLRSAFLNGSVSVIDTQTHSVVGSEIPVGPLPRGSAFTPNQSPRAEFIAEPAVAGSASNFDAGDSVDSDGKVALYRWDYGDGETSEKTTPTVSHTYEEPGDYTVRLATVDDEGNDGSTVFNGVKVSQNGSTLAQTQKQVHVEAAESGENTDSPDSLPSSTVQTSQSSDICTWSLFRPKPSVSHWLRAQNGLRLRIVTPAGGYLLSSQRHSQLILEKREVKGIGGHGLRKVEFYIDGKLQHTDRKAPYSTSLDPRRIERGKKGISVVAHTSDGKKLALGHSFVSSRCEGPAFSVGMSSKGPGTYPQLTLRAQSGDTDLKKVEFSIPSGLSLNDRILENKAVGTVKLTSMDGSRTRSMKLDRRQILAASIVKGAYKAKLSSSSGGTKISFTNLARGTTAISLTTKGGRGNSLFRNTRNCNQRHRFKVQLVTTSGLKTTLTRSLVNCKDHS